MKQRANNERNAMFTRLSLMLTAVVWLTSCASDYPSRVDDHFGEALKASTLKQSYSISAPDTEHSKPGMDGQAAKSSIDRYQKSFDNLPNTVNSMLNSTASGSASH